ncbi:MAG: methylenetetrahydrofolate reductase [Sphingomonas sp.]|uniref:methylenetetrahydrofolate reductase n=2 Tax=Sphingomonadaceae TaxID=41297 RepID=UPI00223817B1|nr:MULTISPECIES: methylenetetrahydrofolate reductase [Sphingomonas]MBV8237134.1 methylenetetrahydrofolate reductase [Sphingomonas sp.]MCW6533046.1 methylenetetrahydrofolate reductase [Sphingomonas lycopersici]
MTVPVIHPAWSRAPLSMTDGYSLEMTAKDRAALAEAAPLIAPETPVAITFLPGEAIDARIDAARDVRALGFEPMPHLSARRIASHDELEQIVRRTVAEAGAKRMFLVAGDPPIPAGPFADTMALLATGLFEANGITAIGIAGHPEGHPAMDEAQCWAVLEEKRAEITQRGMATLIVTQFGFDADPFIRWLEQLRARGIDCPVRIGVPGPAGIKTLLRFAAHCGVGASAAVMTKYGVSLTKLLGTAGPDKLVDRLAARLTPAHGPVRLHFYPFGGLARTVEWINAYEARL